MSDDILGELFGLPSTPQTNIELWLGDCRNVLRGLPADHFHTCVTSPPYFGLRDYGQDKQIGLEPTPDEFVDAMVQVFREVRRVLRPDGSLWLNLGDSYSAARSYQVPSTKGGPKHGPAQSANGRASKVPDGLKPKDLIGIPWRVAFALQKDGWWLRQDIVWCLSGGAWVYARTTKGDMPIMIKDLVRSDPAKIKLWNGARWTNVLGWGPSNDQSDRVEIILRSGERIGCTGKHLWPTQRGNVCASDLVVGDVIQSCTLPEPEDASRPAYLTDDVLWLIGLYLAEGSKGTNNVNLSLNADEAHWLPRISAIVAHYGGSLGHTISGNNLAVRIWGKALHAIIDTFVSGRNARTKHLANAVWRLPNDSIIQIINGYLDGDGHWDGARFRLGFCRNYELERDLRTAAARLSATLTLSPTFSSCLGKKHPAFRGEWRWKRSGHLNEKERSEVVELRRSRARNFWDIAVEDEPHVFSLASGVLTHNCKPNPMPESVTDRCTKAHEYIFLLTKSDRYFFDSKAIAEPTDPSKWGLRADGSYGGTDLKDYEANGVQKPRSVKERLAAKLAAGEALTRNKRSVWSVSAKPFKGAHFATFPPDLIRPCILAGASEKGCCPTCGKPWRRVTERMPTGWDGSEYGQRAVDATGGAMSGGVNKSTLGSGNGVGTAVYVTQGWAQDCTCPAHEPIPSRVLDPFGGAGTTALVAAQEGRSATLIELNPDYREIAHKRLIDAKLTATISVMPTTNENDKNLG